MPTFFWKDHWKPLFLGGLCIFFLLAWRDVLVLNSPTWPHLHGIVDVSTSQWEEIACYMPFANRCSPQVPFPAKPYSDPSFSQFNNFPFLTVWVEACIYKVVCLRRSDAFLFLMHTFFPLACFMLLYRLYFLFIGHRKWILFFSFAGILVYNNFSYSHYALTVLRHPSMQTMIEAASPASPEITRMPSPSFTFFFFLFCFFLTLRSKKPSPKACLGLSALWALNAYVYLFNFILGAMFWTLYLGYVQWMRDKTFSIGQAARQILPNLFVMLLGIAPIAAKNVFSPDPINREIIGKMNVVTRAAGMAFHPAYFLMYFVLPVLAVLLVMRIYQFDLYELFYKFSPILIVLVVELFVLNLHMIFGKFLQPHLFSIRIGVFFFHFLYVVPILYYLDYPPKLIVHNSLPRLMMDRLSKGLQWIVIEKSAYYLLPAALMLAGHSLASSVQNYRHHEQDVAPAMLYAQQSYQSLTEGARAGDVVVSDILPVNLIVPAFSKQASLWVNTFNNYESTHEIIRRFAVFARIYQWDQDQFLSFMLPSEPWRGFYQDPRFQITPAIYQKGLGYWLTFHQKALSEPERIEYQATLIDLYQHLSLERELAAYKIRWIQSADPIAPSIPARRKQTLSDFTKSETTYEVLG